MFISGTKWPVVVVAKSNLTIVNINPAKLLHGRLGHIAPTAMKPVIRSGIATGSETTVHDLAAHVPTG